jgi:hypothetical protein
VHYAVRGVVRRRRRRTASAAIGQPGAGGVIMLTRSLAIDLIRENTISSISDDEPSLPPSWPEPSPGTTVSMGVPSRPALQRRSCLRTSYSVTGKVHPFPADPQVSSIAQEGLGHGLAG